MRTSVRASILATAAALALGSCGGDDEEEAPAPGEPATEAEAPGDAGAEVGGACDLVTAEEAEAAMGKPVKLDDSQSNSTFGVCTYQSEAGDNFIVTLAAGAGPQAYESAVKALPQSTGNEPQPIEGIGDEAVFVATGEGAAASNGAMYVIAADDYLSISYSGEADPEEVTRAAAEAAVGRL